jgi:predicted nuclease of predicted toxin-antitoxin system
MRFKVDENLPVAIADLLRQHHYDAMTILEQQMSDQPDETIVDVCQREHRVLITLDLDFSDIRCYPPENYAGIIVLRPANQGIGAVLRLTQRLLPLLDHEQLTGSLWIVDEQRVRIRGGNSPVYPGDNAS